jgi:hypothetical protein
MSAAMSIDPLDRLRLQRGAQHLHRLGARAVAGYIEDLAARIGGMPAALKLLCEYEQRLTPELIRATGGDRFPPQPLREVAA